MHQCTYDDHGTRCADAAILEIHGPSTVYILCLIHALPFIDSLIGKHHHIQEHRRGSVAWDQGDPLEA